MKRRHFIQTSLLISPFALGFTEKIKATSRPENVGLKLSLNAYSFNRKTYRRTLWKGISAYKMV